MEQVQRRLVAILAADVAGFSRLVEKAEEKTIVLLRSHRETINRAISLHQGRIFTFAGDGFCAEFPSSVEAVRCGLDIQSDLASASPAEAPLRMTWRIGIHFGDIVVEDDTLQGDCVNIAARIQALAEPGAIFISADVYQQVRKKIAVNFQSVGQKKLKNIVEPVRVYRVTRQAPSLVSRLAALPLSRPGYATAIAATICAIVAVPLLSNSAAMNRISSLWGADRLPDRPSIAVLPLQNVSGDAQQDYFSAGLTSDLTTDLAKFKNLFVIANNSANVYKNKAATIQEIGHTLNVRYVLEGSVQRETNRLRVNAQLIDAATGEHIWAERYDRNLTELFAVQDDLLQQIVSSLSLTFRSVEEKKAFTKDTTNLEAKDYYWKGREYLDEYTQESIDKAEQAFEKALSLDPKYWHALSDLSYVHLVKYQELWSPAPEADLQTAVDMALRAIQAAGDDYYNIWGYAMVLYAQSGAAEQQGKQEDSDRLRSEAIKMYNLALKLNQSDAGLLVMHADLLAYQGVEAAHQAVNQIRRAMELNPLYPEWYLWSLGAAQFHAHEYQSAVETLTSMKSPQPRVFLNLAASYARLSENADDTEKEKLLAQSREQLKVFRQQVPDWTIEREQKEKFSTPEAKQHWIGALAIAGAS